MSLFKTTGMPWACWWLTVQPKGFQPSHCLIQLCNMPFTWNWDNCIHLPFNSQICFNSNITCFVYSFLTSEYFMDTIHLPLLQTFHFDIWQYNGSLSILISILYSPNTTQHLWQTHLPNVYTISHICASTNITK